MEYFNNSQNSKGEDGGENDPEDFLSYGGSDQYFSQSSGNQASYSLWKEGPDNYMRGYENANAEGYSQYHQTSNQDANYQPYEANHFSYPFTQMVYQDPARRSQSFGYSHTYFGSNQFTPHDIKNKNELSNDYMQLNTQKGSGSAGIHADVIDNPGFEGQSYEFGYDESYSISPFSAAIDTNQNDIDFSHVRKDTPFKNQEYSQYPKSAALITPKLLQRKSEVKDIRKRRKSSALDLFDDVNEYHKQIDKQLENIPDQCSPKSPEVLNDNSQPPATNKIMLKSTLASNKASSPYKPK